MTINEYRAKHKRCRTCEYVKDHVVGWFCSAKQKRYYGPVGMTKMQGCFCRLYKPIKE